MKDKDKIPEEITFMAYRRKKDRFSTFLSIILFIVISMFFVSSIQAADQENCLLCHRYSGLGCFDQVSGDKRIFYINEQLFSNTVHGKLKCTNCHTEIKEVPHKPSPSVDCGTKCHVKDPSTDTEFSHQSVIKAFEKGVHAKKLSLFYSATGQPKCKYCHTDPLYFPQMDIMPTEPDFPQKSLKRCEGCHTQKTWTNRFVKHFVSRMSPRWNNKEVVTLCNNCHADKDFMSPYGLESTADFESSFHYRNVKYETEDAANCLGCHAPADLGYSVHIIKANSDPNSSLSDKNRLSTCGQDGCHKNVSQKFAFGGKIHATGTKELLLKNIAQQKEKTPAQEKQMMADMAKARQEKTRLMLLGWVKLFYKVLIVLLGGFMIIHQALDIQRAFKNQRIRHQIVPSSLEWEEEHTFYQRMSRQEIWQHNLSALSVIILVLTGVMSILPTDVVKLLFGNHSAVVYNIRYYIHLIFAGVLGVAGVWHTLYLCLSKRGRAIFKDMTPNLNDLIHLKENFQYFLGRKDTPPAFDRFNYQEKLEYITGSIGIVIISITGLVMIAAPYFPKLLVDVAGTVHLMEATLAVIAISVWHIFAVHWKPGKFPMDTAWLDGKISLKHLHEEHPLEYHRVIEKWRKDAGYSLLNEPADSGMLVGMEVKSGGDRP